MEPEILYTLQDIDNNSGQIKAQFAFSRSRTKGSGDKFRIDNITEDTTNRVRGSNSIVAYSPRQYFDHVVQYLSALFLPIGYPYSVTEDYTTYQIFDSIQAFASSIAGLLSSRAVLQSLDVISTSSTEGNSSIAATSTSAATAATLLSVLQTTVANVTSILFASRAAPRISSEVKYYRFLADVVNDAAFVLDLLAPALASNAGLPLVFSFLPISPRALVLCTSSMMRSICGVAAGSSKAVLSNHFARNNPESVGDLNAKDGSQETVVGLIGMWVGGIVVSRVESTTATWCWMIGLLCLHLWANYQAVRSVRLNALNRERATMVCEALCATPGSLSSEVEISVDTVRSNESILGITSFCHSVLTWLHIADVQPNAWKSWRIGMSLHDFIQSLDFASVQGVDTSKEAYIGELIDIFKTEAYLLHWNQKTCQALVVLKKEARPVDQFKAWLHATYVQHRFMRGGRSDAVSIVTDTLFDTQTHWDKWCSKLKEQGWDLETTNLESMPSRRLHII